MKLFEELEKKEVKLTEEETLEYWKKIDILNKCMEERKDAPKFVFYDGPATANGFPGLHHMIGKFIKDTFCKYKNMKGYRVVRKVGWDTHGLPVELQVEKELGFSGKKDIEKYGIKEFNEKCREAVRANEKAFTDLTDKMGQFIDTKHPYVTYNNDYIETEWWILKKFFDEGLFYEGHKILPYCTRCGTGLASHEVAQGYKDITVDTVIVPMKRKDEDTYFLVWTTTPWTLMNNVALCVNPNETYIKASSQGYNFIVAKALANNILGNDYEVLEEYKGKDLEFVEYEQLLPFVKPDKKAFFVTCDDYVTMSDGTGIVHIAPAFGQDDYNVGRKYNLPVLCSVGEDGKYTEGPWKGMVVFDADIEIIKYLKTNDKLFKKIKMTHSYPHCWRCSTPLLYYAKPSYYLKVTELKDKIISENNKVNWYPKFVGEKRFGNWLENMNDWAISRTRYWGTPLPLWKCACGHTHMIGSREELKELAVEKIDTIELHRPFVDEIHIRCPKCNGLMSRTPEVIDCWFDSGSMPFAQYHYPFENLKLFEEQFPADFIAEGIDQTRGWFYVLLVISTFVMGKAPYKNVLVNELLLDANGVKMSKSKGNIVEPFTTMEKYGADAVRFYIPYASPTWTPLKFDYKGITEVISKFFNTLKNTYNFFAIYACADNIDPRTFEVEYEKRAEIDKWLLSKYEKLVKYVTESYEAYDLNKVTKALTEFVSEDLSNWYIRRNRRRFWSSTLDTDKMAVYKTTYEVLLGLTKLLAPISPFTSEEIYRKLTNKESVHLEMFPECNESLINEHIEERMDLVRTLVGLGREARENAKIKVRQPISEVLIDVKYKSLIGDMVELIEEELNVKEVKFIDDASEYMTYVVKPNFKVAGPIFGPKIKEFANMLYDFDPKTIDGTKIKIGDDEFTLSSDLVEIKVNSKEGFDVSAEDNKYIILNTVLTKDLIDEGYAREIVSKVQQERKNQSLDIVERINLYFSADDEIKEAIKNYKEYIMNETLSLDIKEKDNINDKFDINGHEVYLEIERN